MTPGGTLAPPRGPVPMSRGKRPEPQPSDDVPTEEEREGPLLSPRAGGCLQLQDPGLQGAFSQALLCVTDAKSWGERAFDRCVRGKEHGKSSWIWLTSVATLIAVVVAGALVTVHLHAAGGESGGRAPPGQEAPDGRARRGTPSWLREWQDRSDAGEIVFTTDPHLRASLMPNLGNGYIGTQFGRGWMYVNGLYNGRWTSSRRARLPTPFNVGLRYQPSATSLDFGRGAVEQLFRRPGLRALQRTYLHQDLPHVAVVDLEIRSVRGAEKLAGAFNDTFDEVLSRYFPGAGEGGGEGARPRKPRRRHDDLDLRVAVRNDTLTCVEGTTTHPETKDTPRVKIGLCRANPPKTLEVSSAATRILLVSVVWTSLEPLPPGCGSPLEAAMQEYAQVSRSVPELLYQRHVGAMQWLWRTGVEVRGNVELTKTIKSSWWNLLLSYRAGQNLSSSPGGLANDCYGGHSFWDVEQFMWPNLLMFHPALAAGSLQYRFDRRRAAAAIATSFNHDGLQFPWESGSSGQEVSPWRSGVHEIHIIGDISFAFWQYWQASGDRAWLREVGWPVLLGCAQFWASRAAYSPNDGLPGLYRIGNVIDVDEEATHVVNSAYTNAVAKLSLTHAAMAADLLQEQDSVDPKWHTIAKELPIPFDSEEQRHKIHSSATGGTGLGVIMLQYPLDMAGNWSKTVRRNDLIYYAEQKKKANAMYWWAFVIAWLGLREPRVAEKYLRLATVRNVFGPFRAWSELPGGGGCPNFVTGAGAYLQIFWAGYGGVRLTDDALSFHNPRLPPNSTGLDFHGLAYRGSLLDVRITADTISLQLSMASPKGAPALRATHSRQKEPRRLRADGPSVFLSAGTVTLQVVPPA